MRLACLPIVLQLSPIKHLKSLMTQAGKTSQPSFGALLRGHPSATEPDSREGRHGPRGGASPPTEGPEHGPRKLRGAALEDAAIDSAARQAAHLGPPPGVAPLSAPLAPTVAEAVTARARTSLEDLLPALVRRVAWSGDGRRGAVHLELGAGPLAGGKLLIQADGGRVRVQLSAPEGASVEGWRERIAGRLEARGLVVDEVAVD